MLLVGTNVFNMIDWYTQGIEPRTGMVIEHIRLVDLTANDLQGPALTLDIRFNQFSNVDYGFGVGWELNLTHILTVGDGADQQILLILGNGERYLFDKTQELERGDEVKLIYKQKNTFKLIYEDEGYYRLWYKEGGCEEIDGGHTQLIHDDLGRYLRLKWNGQGRLVSIQQSSDDQLIVGFEYIKHPEDFTIRARVKQRFVEGAAQAVDEYWVKHDSVGFSNPGYLMQVARGASKAVIYSFIYHQYEPGYYFLVNISRPYNFNGKDIFLFDYLPTPDGLSVKIPYAKRHDASTLGQDASATTIMGFGFSDGSYLGYRGAGQEWVWNKDNLQSLPDSYQYTTRSVVGDLQVVCSYNKYYLLEIEEKKKNLSSIGTEVRVTEFLYALVPGIDKLNMQSPAFDMPITETSRFTFAGSSSARSTSQYYRYDSFSNLLSHTRGDGIVEEYEYYPAEGKTPHCPPERNGFIRYLKAKKVIPRGATGAAVAIEHEFSYIPPVKGINAAWVRPRRIWMKTPSGVVQSWTYEYELGGEFEGALKVAELAEDAEAISPGVRLATLYVRSKSDGKLTVKKHQIAATAGQGEIVEATVYEALTGHVLETIHETTDENDPGHRDVFTYDVDWGWCTSAVFASERQGYEVTELTTYDPGTNKVVVTRSDGTPKKETIIDRYGRVLQESKIIDYQEANTPKTATVWQCNYSYDSQGHMITTAVKDYLWENHSATLKTTKTTEYSWNLFGELLTTTFPDGATRSTLYENVLNPPSDNVAYRIVFSGTPGRWKEVNEYDSLGLLVAKRTYEARPQADRQVDVETYTYDGLNRQCKVERQHGETTTLEYDVFNRIITSTGDVSKIVKTEYQPHSSQHKPISITLLTVATDPAPMVAGTYSYDDFGRLLESTINGVKIFRTYAAPHSPWQVKNENTLGGTSVTYAYIAELGKVKSMMAIDSRAPYRKRKVEYSYLPGSDRLSMATVDINPLAINVAETAKIKQVKTRFTYDAFAAFGARETDLIYDNADVGAESSKIVYTRTGGGEVLSKEYSVGANTWRNEYSHGPANGLLTEIKFKVWTSSRWAEQLSVRYERSTFMGNRQESKKLALPSAGSEFKTVRMHDFLDRPAKSQFACSTGSDREILDITLAYQGIDKLASLCLSSINVLVPFSATESYSYDRAGRLLTWARSGNVPVIYDEGRTCVSQTITRDHAGRINRLASVVESVNFFEAGLFKSYYSYAGSMQMFSCIKIKAEDAFQDVSTALAYDLEANVTRERVSSLLKGITTTHYGYYAGGGLRSIRIVGGASYKKYYLHDDAKRLRLSYEHSPLDGQSVVQQHEYDDDELIVSCELSRTDSSLLQSVIYHRSEGELLGVTVVDAQNNRKTFLQINGPNQTSLARVGDFEHVKESIEGARFNVFKFTVYTTGVNAVGFAAKVQEHRCRVVRGPANNNVLLPGAMRRYCRADPEE